MKNFIIVFFCLVFGVCLGQGTVLLIPKNGNFKLQEKNLVYNDLINLIRPDVYAEDTLYYLGKSNFFSNITFLNNANFSQIIFPNSIYFANSKFEKGVDFSFVTYQKEVNFFDIEFNGLVLFESALFNENIHFVSSGFFNRVYFDGMSTKKDISFNHCVFGVLASFENSNCSGSMNFDFCRLPNILNFNDSKNIKIDFREAIVDFNKYANFKDDESYRIDTLHINYNFEDQYKLSQKLYKCIINLRNAKIDNIILPFDKFWVDVTYYSYEEKTTLYEKLIKKCKEEGMAESVIGWSIELKKSENLYNFPQIGSFLNWFQGIFWNYGYTKSLILLWILGAFLLFNLLNFFIYPQLINVYFNPKLGLKLITKPLAQDAEAVIGVLKKSPAIRLRYMLHYTGMIFFGIKLEHTDMSFKNLRWVFVLYFQFVTGIILLGFALNFVVSK